MPEPPMLSGVIVQFFSRTARHASASLRIKPYTVIISKSVSSSYAPRMAMRFSSCKNSLFLFITEPSMLCDGSLFCTSDEVTPRISVTISISQLYSIELSSTL